MYVSKIMNKKTGRVFIQIVESYRDVDKMTRHRVIQPLGYVDELEKKYDDPIAFFKLQAKEMTRQKQEEQAALNISISPATRLQKNDELTDSNRKNLGYAALSSIYHQLEIDYFLNNRRRYTKASYNHNAIFKLLVYDRILFPSSKRGAWFHKQRFFEQMDFSLDDVYRSLDFFLTHRDQLLMAMHKKITKLYDRDTTLVYYDVTNYYFEIDREDSLRIKGVCKEHRPNPIVQMGLFMDEHGLPITYGLYPGNNNDVTTLIPMMADLTYDFEMKDMIVVADKGMMSGQNISRIRLDHNGYVISYSVRGAAKGFQKYILEQTGYTDGGKDSKYKSRIQPREIWITDHEDKKKKTTINEWQIVFYSQKYADKAKRDRQKAVAKARDLVKNPTKYTKASLQGAAKYVSKLHYDEYGQVIQKVGTDIVFDEKKLAEEEQLDGYYVIMTNVIGTTQKSTPFKGKSRYTLDGFFQLNRNVTDTDIIDMYKGLWKIEETFKVTKSDLRTRPVYLSQKEHIEAHFLVCFVALTILRLLEYRLGEKYSAGRIARSLEKASGTLFEDGYYVFDYYDEVLEDIGKEFGLDFSKKYLKVGEIRKMMGKTKKTE